jgi:hypothetical protein
MTADFPSRQFTPDQPEGKFAARARSQHPFNSNYCRAKHLPRADRGRQERGPVPSRKVSLPMPDPKRFVRLSTIFDTHDANQLWVFGVKPPPRKGRGVLGIPSCCKTGFSDKGVSILMRACPPKGER